MAALTVWAVYLFQIGAVNLGGVPVPAPAPGFWREWQSAQFYLTQPWPNYLFGQTSTTGWWYYFPVALLVKTPLPILILLVVALGRTLIKRTWRADAIFLVPMALIFGSLLFSTNNLGYRYLLPLLPLAGVYSAYSLALSLRPVAFPSPRHLVTVSLLLWFIIGTLLISPYYLTYFNELAGGPNGGRYILSDSNLDWGQDLVGLKNYLDRNNLASIKLSYFGISHPSAYGLSTEALPPVRTAAEFEGPPALEAIGAAQADIAWCDHLVIAHPLWHGMHPAALKAFFEQTFRYGFAMTNEARGFPKPLLTGKSARSIVTMGMPAFIYRWWFGAYAMRALETSLLGLAGIRPQRRTIIGGLGALTKEKAAAHLKAVEELGRRGV